MALVPPPRPAPDSLVHVAATAGTAGTHWSRQMVVRLVVLETLAAAVAAAVVIATRSGPVPAGSLLFQGSLGLVVAWPAVLASSGAYSRRIFGTGSDEYRRVGQAGLVLL